MEEHDSEAGSAGSDVEICDEGPDVSGEWSDDLGDASFPWPCLGCGSERGGSCQCCYEYTNPNYVRPY